jgi:hypothetical protein
MLGRIGVALAAIALLLQLHVTAQESWRLFSRLSHSISRLVHQIVTFPQDQAQIEADRNSGLL